MSGSRCGTDGRSERGGALAREGSPASRREPKRDVASFELGIGAFVDDEGGYTSVAVALALLVSLSLVCSLVSVAWVQNRSADVRSVADSAALAGANVVAAYSTVATTLDACVLTLGLAGMVTLGAGLVVSAVPGLSAVGAETVATGVKMLDARREFAMSAARGLEAVEKTLPLAIAARSAAVVEANEGGGSSYIGCAIPFPQESQSDFSALEADVTGDEIAEVADDLRDASDRAKDAQDRLDEALREGWLADCGGEPMNMRERADSLAGLLVTENPHYPSPESWTFGVPLLRSRSYYVRRAAIEAPTGQGIRYLTDSECRLAFYEYALSEMEAGYYLELPDGSVDIDLPSLPKNTGEMQGTRLYTDVRWPCTQEGGRATLHSTLRCPGAQGASAGEASLSQLDAGVVARCPTCQMSSADMGKVAAASTSIDNGYEYYWARVVAASLDYEAAADDLAAAEAEMRDYADEGASAFEEALETLASPRLKICPPGAWGCVAVVGRGEGDLPDSLENDFAAPLAVSTGAAISAATLAPDSDAAGNDVLTRFLEALGNDIGWGCAGVLGGIGELWAGLLRGYGSSADGLSDAASEALSDLSGTLLGPVASWLNDKLSEIVRAVGFEPADLRLRKPVLTNSQNVFDRAGFGQVANARELIERLPDAGDPASIARALGQVVVNELGGGPYAIAELPIPGTDITVPLTIDVGALLGAGSS